MSAAKKGLGRGLGALMQETEKEMGTENLSVNNTPKQEPGFYVDIDLLIPNPQQPRTEFDQEALQDLSETIKDKGILQPPTVEEVGDGTYYIIAGERRTRAARLAGLKKIPVIVKKYSEQEKLEVALIENIQRENLSPLEEARAYHNLMVLANLNQEELARRVGKNRSTVANALRLLKLPEDMQNSLLDGTLSAGHARAVLSVSNQTDQRILFARIMGGGLSVRDAEALASEMNTGIKQLKTKKISSPKQRDPDYAFLEQQLIEILSTKVSLSGNFDKGSITIEYFSRDDLDRIFETLSNGHL